MRPGLGIFFLLVPLLMMAGCSANDAVTGGTGGSAPLAGGELLVQFADPVSDEEASRVLESAGATILGRPVGRGPYRIGLPGGMTPEEGVERFGSLPGVRYAEPNYARQPR